MYVLTENGTPIRKAHTAAKAWGNDAVAGHPVDGEGICVFDDGRKLEVREYALGTDVWRITHAHTSYYFGSARALWREYGFFNRGERLNWNAEWEVVYD